MSERRPRGQTLVSIATMLRLFFRTTLFGTLNPLAWGFG